jgi:UDP-GlcNAc:undecaprenyl-phosphate GlcNAc-1-phosphate transferase
MGIIGLIAVAASVYLVYVLEILKFKHWRARELRRQDPDTSEFEVEQAVERDIETGEFERVSS